MIWEASRLLMSWEQGERKMKERKKTSKKDHKRKRMTPRQGKLMQRRKRKRTRKSQKWKVKIPKRATGGQRGRIQSQAAAGDQIKGRGLLRRRKREPARRA